MKGDPGMLSRDWGRERKTDRQKRQRTTVRGEDTRIDTEQRMGERKRERERGIVEEKQT